MQDFATEFEFDLPKGYIDAAGTLHKHGVMRLATAADEILPLRDPRVQQNSGYLTASYSLSAFIAVMAASSAASSTANAAPAAIFSLRWSFIR